MEKKNQLSLKTQISPNPVDEASCSSHLREETSRSLTAVAVTAVVLLFQDTSMIILGIMTLPFILPESPLSSAVWCSP